MCTFVTDLCYYYDTLYGYKLLSLQQIAAGSNTNAFGFKISLTHHKHLGKQVHFQVWLRPSTKYNHNIHVILQTVLRDLSR